MKDSAPVAGEDDVPPPAAPPPDGDPPPFQDLLRTSERKQDLCVLAVLTWIAACDGKIDPKEQALLERVAEANNGAADLPAVQAAVRLCRPKDLEAACRFIRNQTTRGEKRLLARLAVTMAVQDGHFTLGENHILQFLADLLGIRPRAFARLFEEITRRPFPVPGDPSDPAWWKLREAGGRTPAGVDAWGPSRRGDRRWRTWRPWRAGRAGGAFVPPPWDGPAAAGFAGRPGPAAPADTEDGDGEEPMTRAEALRLLGLGAGASPDAVHAAYRRLAKARHPDRFARLGAAAVATATFAFERLSEAYALLKAG